MTLYHGSTIEVREPAILRSDVGRDFGPAFYTTDIREQAERWAVRRMHFARRSGAGTARAVVSVYTFDECRARTMLRCRDFGSVSLDWLDTVVRCRSSLAYRHGFDLMSGRSQMTMLVKRFRMSLPVSCHGRWRWKSFGSRKSTTRSPFAATLRLRTLPSCARMKWGGGHERPYAYPCHVGDGGDWHSGRALGCWRGRGHASLL